MGFLFTGIKEEAAFNVAVVELGGHLPIKSEQKILLYVSHEYFKIFVCHSWIFIST
jgi:hypothetical protein